MFENEDEWVSKTQMKKQMNDLQALGMELTKLSTDTLKKIGLDEDLYELIVGSATAAIVLSARSM